MAEFISLRPGANEPFARETPWGVAVAISNAENNRNHDNLKLDVPAVGKKLHHTVPRFYLKAWAKDDRVYCLHDGQIFRANVRNVGAENHFYRLHELSEEDVSLIRHLAIDKSPEKLKPSHERLVRAFALPHTLKRQLQDSGKLSPERLAAIEKAIAELNENLHTSIEADFKPYLDSMLGGDISFYADPAHSSLFLRGIAAQYLRTNILDKARESLGPDRVPIFRRIMNVLVHIFAINLGLSLFLDRERYLLTPLNNASEVPFITGDQPIINLRAHPRTTDPPEQCEFYYPLSPTKAMLLLEPSSKHLPHALFVGAISAHVYNLHMAAHSHQQVFANSEEELKAVKRDLPAFLSCL